MTGKVLLGVAIVLVLMGMYQVLGLNYEQATYYTLLAVFILQFRRIVS